MADNSTTRDSYIKTIAHEAGARHTLFYEPDVEEIVSGELRALSTDLLKALALTIGGWPALPRPPSPSTMARIRELKGDRG